MSNKKFFFSFITIVFLLISLVALGISYNPNHIMRTIVLLIFGTVISILPLLVLFK
jgi:uncharacterized membrane protein